MTRPATLAVCLALLAGTANAQDPSISIGPADATATAIHTCAGGRPTDVGQITSTDGKTWTVPAETRFGAAPLAPDLYNPCTSVTPSGADEVDIAALPVIDAGGSEEFVAYLFGDNYFELFANGQLLGVDAVPFTPFNSSVVRFRADRPVTFAVKMVDWEENLGLGSEAGRGFAYSPGDGGLTVLVTDMAGHPVLISDNRWKAQTYYISPLEDPACLDLSGSVRDSSECPVPRSNDGAGYYAAHWPIPKAWFTPDFNDNA